MQRPSRPPGVYTPEGCCPPPAALQQQGVAASPSDSSSYPEVRAAGRVKRARLGAAAYRAPFSSGVGGAPLRDAASEEETTDTEACVAFEGEDGLDVSFPLKAVERSFRCSLCKGYFRDAVTLKECLHTFCRWCLYSYVEAAETEEVCCPACERNMQLAAPHRDGAGRDSRRYMPRVTAACVAAASSQAASSSSSSGSSSSGAAAANAAVLFDRTMQNVVDKLFPHFAEEEKLEEEELRAFMLKHQHKQLPPEYLVAPLAPGAPFRREALAHRKARLEARAAAEEALGPPPLDPPPLPQDDHLQQQQQQHGEGAEKAAGRGLASAVKHEQREGLRSSRRGGGQQQQQPPPPLDEFVDQLLEAPSCFDEQQTMAIALLPDTYQGDLMRARLQHEAAAQQRKAQEGPPVGPFSLQEAERGPLWALPLQLPQLERPYLRVPSRMSVQLVLRYLSAQLQPLLLRDSPSSSEAAAAGAAAGPFTGRDGGETQKQVDLESALELLLEGSVLGRSHSLDFVRKARRLSCAGKCLLLQYRYTAQTETRVVAYHLARLNARSPSRGPPSPSADSDAANPSC
ncbi:hypothetical protein Esti_006106 [Eimeria stiedai]